MSSCDISGISKLPEGTRRIGGGSGAPQSFHWRLARTTGQQGSRSARACSRHRHLMLKNGELKKTRSGPNRPAVAIGGEIRRVISWNMWSKLFIYRRLR